MDYLEIMNFCGFDLEKADAMANEQRPEHIDEVLKDCGLESLEPKPC